MSAVIVSIPAADAVVADHRARLDRAAGRCVPAHVTVLFPFMSPDDIDASVCDRLAAAMASVPRASITFDATGWFGTEILWLAPGPPTVFTALTEAVTAAFPDLAPYGGAIEEVVPHLTVGHDAAHAELLRAEAAIVPRLPIRADITGAALWQGADRSGSWSQVREFPLS